MKASRVELPLRPLLVISPRFRVCRQMTRSDQTLHDDRRVAEAETCVEAGRVLSEPASSLDDLPQRTAEAELCDSAVLSQHASLSAVW